MQVFIVLGYIATQAEGSDFEDVTYVYAFTHPDEAMEFIEMAQQHNDDVDRWELLSETVQSAADTYARHRAWVAE
jgi:hypothetical protein